MPTHSALRRIVFVAIPLALSCHDAPTSPGSDPLAPPQFPARDASPGTPQGPVQIGIPDVNYPGGGALGWTATGLTVPAWTSYVVTVDGRTTATRNPAATQCSPGVTFPAEGSYGPAGTNYYELTVAAGWSADGTTPSNIQLNYAGYGKSGGSTATSDTLFAWSGGQLYVQRSGLAGVVGGGTPHCEAGLYLLSTTQAISLTTFDGQELSLTPPAVAVRSGTDVTFTATSRGAVVATPNWRFDVDSGVANATTICGGLSGPNPCLVTVRTSGVLRASKNVQGRMRVAAARVRVYTEFTLIGEPSDVVRGDSVIFTPKLDGVTGPAARWLWRGDDATVVAAPCAAQTDTCVWVPQSSGTMWAYTATSGGDSASKHVTVSRPTLTLTASRTTVAAPGEDVTFTVTASRPVTVLGWSFDTSGSAMNRIAPSGPSLSKFSARSSKAARTSSQLAVPSSSSKLASQGSSWGGCGPSFAQCTNFIGTSGTVDVLASANGDTVRANVEVQVVPCPTGDSLLDSPATRKVFKLLRDSSNASDPVIANRVEREAVLIDSAGRKIWKILALNPTTALNTPCEVNPRVPSGWIILAIAHTHPFKDGERENDPRCPFDGTARYKQTPTTGWASNTDWQTSNAKKVPSYIIDSTRIVRIRGDSAGGDFLTNPDGTGIVDKNGKFIWQPGADWEKWTQEFPRIHDGCSSLAPFAALMNRRTLFVGLRRESVDARLGLRGGLHG